MLYYSTPKVTVLTYDRRKPKITATTSVIHKPKVTVIMFLTNEMSRL